MPFHDEYDAADFFCEEVCPECGMYRGPQQPADSWAFHLSICASIAEREESEGLADYRIFQGKDTKQVDGHTTHPAKPESWYYEPSNYEGDVLYSPAYPTRDAAEHAATSELSETE